MIKSLSLTLLLLSFLPLHMLKAATCFPLAKLTPPLANISDPHKNFYIDLSGITGAGFAPRRDPYNPLYPKAKTLKDGQIPPLSEEGNFIVGPPHILPIEWQEASQTDHGRLISFSYSSQQSPLYKPGIARDDDASCPEGYASFSFSLPSDPSHLIVPNSHEASWEREIDIYIPYHVPTNKALPFLIFSDGGENGIYPGRDLFALIDVLIKEHRLPPMIVIGIGSGGGDAQGSERGREYDTMSGTYADWIENTILPLIEQHAHIILSKNPDDRATMGFSSSGAAAFAMAWFRPNLYHRVLAYSPSLVNQQWPYNPDLPGGGWQLHSPWAGSAKGDKNPAHQALIATSSTKPLRIWYEMGSNDLFYPVKAMPDGMHDWVLAGENLARVLQEKHYHYQFIFSQNAPHVDGATIEQTLPEALEWLWHDRL